MHMDSQRNQKILSHADEQSQEPRYPFPMQMNNYRNQETPSSCRWTVRGTRKFLSHANGQLQEPRNLFYIADEQLQEPRNLFYIADEQLQQPSNLFYIADEQLQQPRNPFPIADEKSEEPRNPYPIADQEPRNSFSTHMNSRGNQETPFPCRGTVARTKELLSRADGQSKESGNSFPMQMGDHTAVNLAESDCDTYASKPNRGFDQADEPAVFRDNPAAMSACT